jgi:hypothetical protein
MNAISGLPGTTAGGVSAIATPAQSFTLRRSGRKAVRFSGWRMVEALGAGEAGSLWYDLSVYRSDTGDIIVELVARRRLLEEQDICRVEVFDTLASAASWLEAYPCASDVPIPATLAAGDGPMASVVLQAVQLRQRLERISDEYHGLLSDVFEVLDLSDVATPEPVAAE